MTKTFCDRCGAETTGESNGAIHGIEEADENGNGQNTHCFDVVCDACYAAWVAWMKAAPLSTHISTTVLGGTDLDVVATEGGKASVERRR